MRIVQHNRFCRHCERRLTVNVSKVCRQCVMALPTWVLLALLRGE